MKTPQRKLISAAIALAIAAGSAHAALERMGPVNSAPSVGGFPSWFQDKTGMTLEFCDLKSQAELNGGWCVLIPPGLSYPEVFPNSFFDEHFYYIADNGLADPNVGGGFRARLVMAVESAFANGAPVDGDQIVFGRHRVFMPILPFDGDYRVITPYTDIAYFDKAAGDRIFETNDVGINCPDFQCALGTVIGPFVLPSPIAGGPEVPPMPALASAPRGTDPYYDLLGTGTTANPGTGKSYLADPARLGPVTGSPLPPFTAFNVDGTSTTRNHNTFRIEVRAPSPNHDGPVIYVIEGENNFAVAGRLMDAPIPGKVTVNRATYKADGSGNVTALDVFASASPTAQARMPAQPQPAPVAPILSFVEAACGGSVTTDPLTGKVTINNPPYAAPVGVERSMVADGTDFWGQSQPGGLPPGYVCVKDATSRNLAGQIVPSYYLRALTDSVKVSLASFDSATGALKVDAVSSDPTAVLMLTGYGPAPAATPGVSVGKGASTGLTLAGNTATVSSLLAPPAKAQVVSSKGGSTLEPVDTSRVVAGGASTTPVAVNDSVTLFEDCSPNAATVCAAGQGFTVDLLANDTMTINGTVTTLRDVVINNLGVVTVNALAPGFGLASIANGFLTYTPNSNANGSDSIAYTVTVDGKVSNQAQLAITVTPVNDNPVAVNQATNAVVNKPSVLSLIANATDPDGNLDVKDAVVVTWPANGLGAAPIPVNGVVTYTPSATGNFSFTYQVKDAAGVLSNTATSNVAVSAAEAITVGSARFTVSKQRWTVTGSDSVLQGQTLTLVYNNGKLRNVAGQPTCDGTTTIPACVIDTFVAGPTVTYTYDKAGFVSGPGNPNDANAWLTKPTTIRVFSSSPVLGGSATGAIQLK